jgi:hypothetical protein
LTLNVNKRQRYRILMPVNHVLNIQKPAFTE